MAGSVNVYKPKVVITSSGVGALSPTNVSIIRYTKQCMSLGGVAHTDGVQDETIVRFLSSEEMAEFAGNVQTQTRNESSEPDISISISADKQSGKPDFGSDEFKGFLVNANYSGSTTSAGVTVGAVHMDSLIGQFIGSVYVLPWKKEAIRKVETSRYKLLSEAIENSMSVAGMVKRCLDVIYNGFPNNIDWGGAQEAFGNDIREVATQQHEGNKKPYEQLTKVLQEEASSMWEEFFEELNGPETEKIRIAIGETIVGMIGAKSNSFMGNLDSIFSLFGCCYCPTAKGGDIGRIVRIQDSLQNPKELTISDTSSLNFRTGSSVAIPVTQVFMSTSSVQASKQANKSIKYFLTYPEGARKGRGSMSVERPPWLMSLSLRDELTVEDLKSESPPPKTIGKGIQSNEDNWKKVQQTKRNQDKLLTSYLKSRYYEVALGGSEAMMTLPYYHPKEEMELGTTYQVKNNKGSVLFTGLLDSLVYTLGTDGSCTREIHFSYVQAGNFKLEE